ncbi:MAG: hypothetical protein ACPGF6_00065 [Porticoccaceae bacterium]
MLKPNLLAIIAVFVVWSILDFLIHGMLLQSTYEATADLWRPMEEMNPILCYGVKLGFSICFVLIYDLLISEKSLQNGIKFGLLLGLGNGLMALGSYVYMPIPLLLAEAWLAAAIVQTGISGAIVGNIIKKPQSPAI